MNTEKNFKITYDGKMLDILIALCPAGLAGLYFFGLRALALICTCVASCMLIEYLWNRLILRSDDGEGLDAVVTGLVLAYVLPPATPLWIAGIGAVIASLIIKCLYGGKKFVNPAFAAKLFIAASFSGYAGWFLSPSILGMDSAATATPLMLIKEGTAENMPMLIDMLLGSTGSIGQASALLIIIGGVYLILKEVISWVIPVFFIGTLAVITFAFAPDKNIVSSLSFAAYNILSGGVLFGAFFGAIGYAPQTNGGKIISGVIGGIITACIRLCGMYPDGSVHAVLIMNIITPVIDKLTLPAPEEIA